MDLKKNKDGDRLTIALSGELNVLAVPELEAMINDSVPETDLLVLDFTECDYVSSAGLRVLLNTFKATKKEGKRMVLTNVGPGFMDVLQTTCLDAVFEME
jgi:anti-sigma B factor antagonist